MRNHHKIDASGWFEACWYALALFPNDSIRKSINHCDFLNYISIFEVGHCCVVSEHSYLVTKMLKNDSGNTGTDRGVSRYPCFHWLLLSFEIDKLDDFFETNSGRSWIRPFNRFAVMFSERTWRIVVSVCSCKETTVVGFCRQTIVGIVCITN